MELSYQGGDQGLVTSGPLPSHATTSFLQTEWTQQNNSHHTQLLSLGATWAKHSNFYPSRNN